MIEDELYRRVKAKAALEGRKVTELVEDGLRAVLGSGGAPLEVPVPPRRLRLPLIPAKTAFTQRTHPLRLRIDVSNVSEALELLEGPQAR